MGIVLTVDGAGHIIRPALSTAPPHPKRGGNLVKIGAVAQLGERHVRNVEVRGSIPLGSTINIDHKHNASSLAILGQIYLNKKYNLFT